LLTKHLAPEYETMLVAGVKMDSEESSEFICKQMGIDYIQVPEMSRRSIFQKTGLRIKKLKSSSQIQARHCSHTCCKGRYPGATSGAQHERSRYRSYISRAYFHSYFHPLKTKIFLAIERYLAKRSSAIIAISDFQKKDFRKYFMFASRKK